jgi:hypothetical protein
MNSINTKPNLEKLVVGEKIDDLKLSIFEKEASHP